MHPETEPDFSDITAIDRFLHEPARLAIMAVLSACESADFQFLLQATRLNKGNLSAQAIKLEEVGYITVEKGFHGRTPFTLYRLTLAGKNALAAYREQLKRALDHF
ncbi:MAG: transcriptional regulator [Anaerolineae bacterium]|nr:transcriptional regulator [Anaerolineae bacterium]